MRIFRTLCLVACRQIWWWSSVSLLARCGGQRPFLRPLCIAAAVITRIGPEACDPAFAAEPGAGEPRVRNQRRRSIKNPGYLGYSGLPSKKLQHFYRFRRSAEQPLFGEAGHLGYLIGG